MNFNWPVFLSALFLFSGLAGVLTSLGFMVYQERPIYLLGLIPSAICVAAGFAFIP